jgi:hypothetical protein
MKRLHVVALAVCCGLAGLAAAANTNYTFSLAGNYPGAFQSDPLAVNFTQIVGYYVTASGSPSYLQTFRGEAAHVPFVTIAPPGGGTSYASGINALSVIAGGLHPGLHIPEVATWLYLGPWHLRDH